MPTILAAEDIASPKQTRAAAEGHNGWPPSANGFQTDSERIKPRKSAVLTDITDSTILSAEAPPTAALRQAIAAIEAACITNRRNSTRVHVDTGASEIDAALGGGLLRGAIHELLPKSAQDLAAAARLPLPFRGRA